MHPGGWADPLPLPWVCIQGEVGLHPGEKSASSGVGIRIPTGTRKACSMHPMGKVIVFPSKSINQFGWKNTLDVIRTKWGKS